MAKSVKSDRFTISVSNMWTHSTSDHSCNSVQALKGFLEGLRALNDDLDIRAAIFEGNQILFEFRTPRWAKACGLPQGLTTAKKLNGLGFTSENANPNAIEIFSQMKRASFERKNAGIKPKKIGEFSVGSA